MVSSYVRLLQRRYADDLPDDAQEFMLFAVDGAKRMSELLKGLLEFSRVTTHANESEPALASELVAEAWKRLAAEVESASASLDVPEELPRVHVDREQALRVFTYLLENATRFAGEEPPKIEIRATLDKRMAVFTVSDNGIGIPEKDQERVFTLFQRLHSREDYPGIGKGLAVARRIVERHGGWIGLESTEGKGTTVRFSLPLAEEAS